MRTRPTPAAVLLLAMLGCADAPTVPQPAPLKATAFLGDSMIERMGPLDAWFGDPARTWVNAGVGGATTGDLAASLRTAGVPGHAQVCFIMVGIVDVAQNVPLDSAEAHVRAIVSIVRAAGATPILTTILPLARRWSNSDPLQLNQESAPLNEWLRAFAKESGTSMVDLQAVFIGTDQYGRDALYLADGLHPNPDGNRLIAATAYRALYAAGAVPRIAHAR